VTPPDLTPDGQKRSAALSALDLVRDGMRLGLGTGSTSAMFVAALGERVAGGLKVVGVATSEATRRQAEALGIALAELDETELDLTIDGADEIDGDLNLIKGGGGALLREKIVAQASKREVIIVDEAKLSPLLGTQWHVPVEVVTFGWRTQFDFLIGLGATVTMRERKDGMPFVTDQGNYILDANFGTIQEPAALANKLSSRIGIVEHGLFVGMASEVIVGQNSGVRILSAG
jgi:ribose 5-phosphate isomerase A